MIVFSSSRRNGRRYVRVVLVYLSPVKGWMIRRHADLM